MNNNINIAELLKDCPKGMELYSPIFGEVYLDKIRPHLAIVVTTDKEQGDFKEEFLYDGRYMMKGECMLFPSKGKNTWEGFVPPCVFNDGDIVATIPGTWIGITEGGKSGCFIPTYCVIKVNGDFKAYLNYKEKWSFDRFATEEEKQKLFQAIKDNGYRWNADTKTLEKEEKKDKFDITTLMPFDKVLVRDANDNPWMAAHFSHYQKDAELYYPYFASGSCFKQCIPYEGDEHLLGTTNDCDDYYKTWNDETDE